ncbi:unnamed protein product [Penicillium pancosmium]
MSNPKDYTVGWICALPTEYLAAQEFLDEEHDRPESLPAPSKNEYTLGRIGRHNVAIATMPLGEYGIASAARVAVEMLHSFPNIRIGLMVGIGGGAPSKRHDIRLGDVVVSIPGNGHGGVLQFDFGKTIQGQSFQLTGYLDQPPTVLRTAVAGLKTKYERKGHQLDQAIDQILANNRRLIRKYKRPDQSCDKLYRSDHVSEDNVNYDPSVLIMREERSVDEDNPMIHYGLIASSNSLMKDAHARDKLATEKDVLCFEMEAAGLMNSFPCLVIRGICDYSDSHKNKEWQGYAAMVAAAYAKDLLNRIAPQHIEAEKRVSEVLTAVNGIRDDTKEIRTTTNNTFEIVTDLHSSKEKQNCQRILEWLTPIDYAVQQNDLVSRCQKGTGTWFLKTKEFQRWLKTPTKNHNHTLFCPGIPGAGKTMITSTVISYLQGHFHDDPGVGIAYIFCNFRQQEQQTIHNLIASLLRQLAKNQHFELAEKLYNRFVKENKRPSFEDLLTTLHNTIAMYSRVIILVDALDEYQANEDRGRFLKDVFHLRSHTETTCSIFATSRYNQLIEELFEKAPRRIIRAQEEDVRKYLDMRIKGFQSKTLNDISLEEEVKVKITGAADGICDRFLLAKLYIDTLASETTPKGIRRALAEWERIARVSKDPSKMKTALLDHAYEVTLERIEHQKVQHWDLARKVLSWVIYAKRNLTPSELQDAVAIEIGLPYFDKENIADIGLSVSVCGGLIVLDQESHVVRLVHYTTQEYLERTWKDRFPESQAGVAKACISYLSMGVFDSGTCSTRLLFEKRLNSYTLYQYAALHWGHHAKEASIETQKPAWNLIQNEELIAAYSQAILFYTGLYRAFRSMSGMTSLHVAAFFGFSNCMPALLDCEYHPDIRRKDHLFGMTPLLWAAKHGWCGVAESLIESGADITYSLRGYATNPLLLAVENGHEAMVKLLIDRGADLQDDTDWFHKAVKSAASLGKTRVLRVMLDSEMSIVNSEAMSHCATGGHEEAMKLFIDRGAEDKTIAEAISYAAREGHGKLVSLGLDRCVGLEKGDWRMNLALEYAALYGKEDIVRLLLNHGADTEPRHPRRTPIMAAAENGHNKVVKLLLDYKADIDLHSDYGNALLCAARGGHDETMRLLIDHGPTLNTNKALPTLGAVRDQCDQDETLLLAFETAIYPPFEVNVPVPQRKSGSPLLWAVYHTLTGTLKLLIDRGAEIESRDGFGETPLAIASRLGHEGMVRLLLEKGAQVDKKTFTDLTPLIIAAWMGHLGVVQALLDHGAKVERKGHLGLTALTAANRGGHEEVVQLLRGRLTQESSNLEENVSESEDETWEEAYMVWKEGRKLWDKRLQEAAGNPFVTRSHNPRSDYRLTRLTKPSDRYRKLSYHR